MARGNETIVSANPRGVFMEGIIGAGLTPKPGTVMQIQAATALSGGRHTFELFNADADGGMPKGPIYVLRSNDLVGKTMTDAYAAGERAYLYTPVAGEELNMRLADIAGTGDDHTVGEMLIIDDTTGLLIATTGSPESEPFQLLETVTDPTAETLAWCMYTGY